MKSSKSSHLWVWNKNIIYVFRDLIDDPHSSLSCQSNNPYKVLELKSSVTFQPCVFSSGCSVSAAAELCISCSVLFCSAAVTQFPPQGSINIISSLSAALHLISTTNVQEFVLLTGGDERQTKEINPQKQSSSSLGVYMFFLFNDIIAALRVVLLNESVRETTLSLIWSQFLQQWRTQTRKK